MEPADRQSCPSCDESVPLATTVCPFCKEDLLVDVVLELPPDDERVRYQLARAIAALDPPAPDFSTALQALADPQPLLVREVSRLDAQRFLGWLEDLGVAGRAVPTGAVSPSRPLRGNRTSLWVGVLLTTLAVLGLLTRHHGTPAPRDSSPPADGLAKARTPPWISPSPSLSFKDLSALAVPSTVEVRCGDRRSTGFFVARDLVLTGLQAATGCFSLQIVTAGGKALEGVVTRQDTQLRLALVHVAGSGAEPLRLGDAASVRSGDRIVLVGMPGPGTQGVREARLGGPARVFHGIVYLPIVGDVRPDAAGGPVLDDQGYAVGVMVPPEETDGNAFLLPINYTYDEAHLLDRPVPGPDLNRWKALLAEAAMTEKLRIEPSQTPETPSPESSPSTQ